MLKMYLGENYINITYVYLIMMEKLAIFEYVCLKIICLLLSSNAMSLSASFY